MMGELKLYGMRNAYDEALAAAVKRKHEPQHFVGDLLKAEISEKQARSIKYQRQSPNCRLPRISTTSPTRGHRSMKASCALWLAATSSLNNAMSSWLGGRARARRIWRSRSHEVVSAPDLAVASSPRSILSTGRGRRSSWPPRPARRLSDAPRLRHPRRARLSALRPSRRTTAVPHGQPPLRANLGHRHDQSCIR